MQQKNNSFEAIAHSLNLEIVELNVGRSQQVVKLKSIDERTFYLTLGNPFELKNISKLCSLGITPNSKILKESYILQNSADGISSSFDSYTHSQLVHFGSLVSRMHSSFVQRRTRELEVRQTMDEWLILLTQSKWHLPKAVSEYIDCCHQSESPSEYTLVHMDLNSSNIFFEGSSFEIIDFEHSQFGFSELDLGKLCILMSPVQFSHFVKGYQKYGTIRMDNLKIAIIIHLVGAVLWCIEHYGKEFQQSEYFKTSVAYMETICDANKNRILLQNVTI